MLVLQIARHWETYRSKMSREMKEAGTFDASVRQAALMTNHARLEALEQGKRDARRAARVLSPPDRGVTRHRIRQPLST